MVEADGNLQTMKLATIFTLLLIAVVLARPLQAQKRSALSSEQQKQLLSRRLPSGVMMGTFGSYGSFLYSGLDIAIHTSDKQIGELELHSPFPEFYKPTIRELLDTIASQTQSSWSYDSQNNHWVFAKPAKPTPYSIALADNWIFNERGVYISYKPPTFKGGMDIYCYGSYSADQPEQESALFTKIRNSWAIGFASRLKRDVTIDEMQSVSVDGADALYFQAPTPRPGAVWRQWVFVKNRQAFVIVSTLPADDDESRSGVESMIKSFHVN